MKKQYLVFDKREGYPLGPELFYECTLCGTNIRSAPAESIGCKCNNLFIDPGACRLSCEQPGSIRLFQWVEGGKD